MNWDEELRKIMDSSTTKLPVGQFNPIKQTSAINSMDYERGRYDGYMEGYNRAFENFKEQLIVARLHQSQTIIVTTEEYEKLKGLKS